MSILDVGEASLHTHGLVGVPSEETEDIRALRHKKPGLVYSFLFLSSINNLSE